MKTSFRFDYILVAALAPESFAGWIVGNLGGTIRSGGNKDSVFVDDVPEMGAALKVYQDSRMPTTDKSGHLALRVPRAEFDAAIDELTAAGCEYADGEKHWRIFLVRVNKEPVGYIHLAYRD